jgi:hypothetical protein
MELGIGALRRPETLRGLGFFLAWGIVGGAVTRLTLAYFSTWAVLTFVVVFGPSIWGWVW